MIHEDAHNAKPQVAGSAHDRHQVISLKLLIAVFVALLVLTYLTVAAWWVDLGPLNIWIALGIAVLKAGLVALFFMHLIYDSLFNGIVLICALVFVALFIGVTLLDTVEYQPQRIEYEAPPSAVQPSPAS